MLDETIEPKVNITSCVTCVTEENCPRTIFFFMNLVNKKHKFMYYVSIKIPLFRGTRMLK